MNNNNKEIFHPRNKSNHVVDNIISERIVDFMQNTHSPTRNIYCKSIHILPFFRPFEHFDTRFIILIF
jgi:hypothetical protein